MSQLDDTRRLSLEQLPPAGQVEAGQEHAREMLAEHHAALVWKEGTDTHVQALRGATRIGRSLQSDVRFEDPSVSRRHAFLAKREDGSWMLSDERSLNGV